MQCCSQIWQWIVSVVVVSDSVVFVVVAAVVSVASGSVEVASDFGSVVAWIVVPVVQMKSQYPSSSTFVASLSYCL